MWKQFHCDLTGTCRWKPRFFESCNTILINYTVADSESAYAYDFLFLSHRGAERQRPSYLRQAIIFEAAMAAKAANQQGSNARNSEALLQEAFNDYNSHRGVQGNRKYALSQADTYAIKNLVLHVDEGVKRLMAAHLDRVKWVDSGAITNFHCKAAACACMDQAALQN